MAITPSKGVAFGKWKTTFSVDEAHKQLVLVDGFVLAPGRKKRELMEELVQVLQTADVR